MTDTIIPPRTNDLIEIDAWRRQITREVSDQLISPRTKDPLEVDRWRRQLTREVSAQLISPRTNDPIEVDRWRRQITREVNDSAVATWQTVFESGDWTINYGAWNGDVIDCEFTGYAGGWWQVVEVSPNGTWHIDFRPTYLRVTFTGSAASYFAMAVASPSINLLSAPTTFTIVEEDGLKRGTVTFNGYDADIYKIAAFVSVAYPFSIDNIEFQE